MRQLHRSAAAAARSSLISRRAVSGAELVDESVMLRWVELRSIRVKMVAWLTQKRSRIAKAKSTVESQAQQRKHGLVM